MKHVDVGLERLSQQFSAGGKGMRFPYFMTSRTIQFMSEVQWEQISRVLDESDFFALII